jgi:kynurenine formamidase
VASVVPSEDEILSWFSTLSNWGRWGPGDRLGTLNHVTPEKRAAAARSVEQGITVSCGWDIPMNVASPGVHSPPQRLMIKTGLGLTDPEPPGLSGGPRNPGQWSGGALEFVSMVFHGRPFTHLDALSHYFWKGEMYGGEPAAHVTDRDGATVHDIRSARLGIHTRGVLLDIARAKGVESLATDEPIFPADLDAAEAAQGVTVEPGDALLVRTGDGRRRASGTWDPDVLGQPGLHAACLPWLHERSVAAIGADGPQELNPSGYKNIFLPVHAVGIVAMGLWLLDNCQLEDLSAMCAALGRWSFFFTATPLRMNGVTGSPLNPVAMF